MQHFRRTLLTVLVLVVVTASLIGSPGVSIAASASPRDNLAPMGSSPHRVPDPNNTGEPDSGSTRTKQIYPAAPRITPVDEAQYAVRALRTIRWTSFVWATRIFGVGE